MVFILFEPDPNTPILSPNALDLKIDSTPDLHLLKVNSTEKISIEIFKVLKFTDPVTGKQNG